MYLYAAIFCLAGIVQRPPVRFLLCTVLCIYVFLILFSFILRFTECVVSDEMLPFATSMERHNMARSRAWRWLQ